MYPMPITCNNSHRRNTAVPALTGSQVLSDCPDLNTAGFNNKHRPVPRGGLRPLQRYRPLLAPRQIPVAAEGRCQARGSTAHVVRMTIARVVPVNHSALDAAYAAHCRPRPDNPKLASVCIHTPALPLARSIGRGICQWRMDGVHILVKT